MKHITELKYRDNGTDFLNHKQHNHADSLEILHVVSGQGVVTVGDKVYPLEADTLYLINDREPHFTAPEDPTAYVRNKMVFPARPLHAVAEALSCGGAVNSLFRGGGCAVRLPTSVSARADACFLRAASLAVDSGGLYEMNFYMTVFSLLDMALRHRDRMMPDGNGQLADAIWYISRNLEDKITLDALAQHTKLSKYRLCRLFKDRLGMTVFAYIESLRVARAKELLTETDLPISNVAQRVGYESFAYFSKVFRCHVGLTPSHYRKSRSTTTA